MTQDLRESVLELLAERTPFSYQDIKLFYLKYNNLDYLIDALEFSAMTGKSYIADFRSVLSPEQIIPTPEEWKNAIIPKGHFLALHSEGKEYHIEFIDADHIRLKEVVYKNK